MPDSHANASVIRWDEIHDAAVDPAHPLGLTTDGVHPGNPGQQQLAQAYADAVGGCGGGL